MAAINELNTTVDAKSFEVPTLGAPRVESPIAGLLGEKALLKAGASERILLDTRLSSVTHQTGELRSFEIAGPRDRIYFDPSKTRAGIVTCGGICPGLNNVIRGLVHQLIAGYGVRRVYGFRYGYEGFIARFRHEVMDLTLDAVKDIHQTGGTILGASRGPQDPGEIVDCLDRMDIGLLFTIGGDGTQRGAMAIVEEIRRRKLNIAVVGVPKTIDNDIPFIERSFGFETAFSEAGSFLRAAKAESRGCVNGVGLVKLMGRHSGFIACHAALAQTDADFVLIPEVPFELDGERGFLATLGRRLKERARAVIVVAEGAGQELFVKEGSPKDASGNAKLLDIGVMLKERIFQYAKEQGIPTNVKYIDPSYQIRSVPANPADSVYCWHLARNAVHCAMSGNTQVVIGYHAGHFVHVPMALATSGRQQVDPHGALWMSVLEATGQPANML